MKKFNIHSIPFIFLFTVVSFSVQSQDSYFHGGKGTPSDPWQISTADQLNEIRHFAGDNFELVNDINLQSYQVGLGWEPIGDSIVPFSGTFNGNGFTISNLRITRHGFENVGLFGVVGSKTSENTGIEKVNLEYVTVIGGKNTGALAGKVQGNQNTIIRQCSANQGLVRGDENVGGLVGANNSYIENTLTAEGYRPSVIQSWTNVEVGLRSKYSEGKKMFGGLVGSNEKGIISDSYALGILKSDSAKYAGGLTGSSAFKGMIINSYANNTIIAEGGQFVGGLTGENGIGSNQGIVINSYWDTETSGILHSDAGLGMPSSAFSTRSSYTDWDFDFIWEINPESGLAFLRETPQEPEVFNWTGNVNDQWHVASNWENQTIPHQYSKVIIPENAIVTIAENTKIQVRMLELAQESGLIISDNSFLSIKNQLSGKGEIKGEGWIVFDGNQMQNIPSISFENIMIDNYTGIRLDDDIVVKGILKMINGLLDLNGYILNLGENATLEERDGTINSSRVYGEQGYIETVRKVNGNGKNIAGLGIEIESASDMGLTVFRRGHNELAGSDISQSILRWFEVIPEFNNQLDAKMTFHYHKGEVNLNTHDNFILFESDAVHNEWLFRSADHNAVDQTLTLSNINTFDVWTAGTAEIHLPVSLTEFSGVKNEHQIKINWKTASEINNNFFTLEKSADGINFFSLKKVDGSGTTSQVSAYEVTDRNPLRGTNYYRLKQTDFDGSYEYSDPIAVRFDSPAMRELNSTVYPNPNSGQFRIDYKGETSVDFTIYDATGRAVYHGELTPMGNNQIQLGNIQRGIYTVMIMNDTPDNIKLLVN